MAMKYNTALSVARAALKADKVRTGHRPVVVNAWVLGDEATKDAVLAVEGPGFIRRGLREAAIRYEDGSREHEAFLTLRGFVALDRSFRITGEEMTYVIDGEIEVVKARRVLAAEVEDVEDDAA